MRLTTILAAALISSIAATTSPAGAETYHFAWKNADTRDIGCANLKIELKNSNSIVIAQDSRSASLKPNAVQAVPPLAAEHCASITLRATCSFGYETKTLERSESCAGGTINISYGGLSLR